MLKLLKFYPTLILGYSVLPLMAGAQTVDSIIANVSGTLQTIIGLLFVIATLIFLWGVVQFIAKSGDEAGREKAKGIMTWGIIGLAVMAAAWGVAQLLINYFGVGGEPIPEGPRQ